MILNFTMTGSCCNQAIAQVIPKIAPPARVTCVMAMLRQLQQTQRAEMFSYGVISQTTPQLLYRHPVPPLDVVP